MDKLTVLWRQSCFGGMLVLFWGLLLIVCVNLRRGCVRIIIDHMCSVNRSFVCPLHILTSRYAGVRLADEATTSLRLPRRRLARRYPKEF